MFLKSKLEVLSLNTYLQPMGFLKFRNTHRKRPVLEFKGLQTCNFIKKKLQDWRFPFSCESCEIFKKIYFEEHVRADEKR